MGKRDLRHEMYRAVARRTSPAVVVNQVGGNDQLVFDGSSFAMNGAGEVIASARPSRRSGARGYRTTGAGRPAREFARRMRSRVRGAGAGHARLHPQMRLQPRADRAQRRHRFGAHRGDRGGGGGARERDRRRHAGAVFVRSQRRDAREMAERLGIRFDVVPITPAYDECCARWRRCSPAARRTSPRRTCRRACAASRSWRSRTSSARWC